jgi:hypothetical protein
MFGFLIGTVCLIGLIKVIRHGRGGCGGGYGYGPPWARGRRGGGCGYLRHGGYDDGPDPEGGRWGRHERGPGFWGGGGGGWGSGRGFLLRALFERLDTTPGQEKVILAAVDEMREAGRTIRSEMRASRADFAKAARSEHFDEVLLGEMFAKHDSAIEALRKSAVGAMAKVHEALDEKQRARLADLIENGPSFFRSFRTHDL